MAKRRRRPKRRKRKVSTLTIILGLIAVAIIGIFFYFLFSGNSEKDKTIEECLVNTYKSIYKTKPVIVKDFDQKANIIYKLTVPKHNSDFFVKKLKKNLPSKVKPKVIKGKSAILVKIDSGNEISKILINLKQTKRKPKKKTAKYQYEEPLPEKPIAKKKKKKIKVKGQPLVAIIIDDCGLGHMESFEKALTIPYPITFAILPFRTYSKKCAYLANGKGYQVILHMPMEPLSYPKADPGPGAIFKTDNKKEITEKLENAFNNITFAKGFNNHMGSAITQSRFAVRVILTYSEKHGKFFIDSRTPPKTVVEEEAEHMGIKVLSRDVFLDNVIDYEHIKKQLEETVKKAYQHGYAIAIGHNYPKTIEILAKEMPEMDRKVNFVFVKDLYYGNYQ